MGMAMANWAFGVLALHGVGKVYQWIEVGRLLRKSYKSYDAAE